MKTLSPEPSICFVSAGYHAMRMGGAELAIKHLADDFRSNGWRVSFVAAGEREDQESNPEGDFIYYYRRHRRFCWESLSSMKRALSRAGAAVYYQRVTSLLTLATARFCLKRDRLMIWAAAHNEDCLKFRHLKDFFRDRRLEGYSHRAKVLKLVNNLVLDLGYHYGIRRASIRVVQTHDQRKLLRQAFNLDSRVLYRGYPGMKPPAAHQETRPLALWVANLRQFKRPDLFIEAARRLQNGNRVFEMIGAPFGVAATQARFEERVAGVGGLHYLGSLSHDRVMARMERASLLALTSRTEGFPSVLIEAWMRQLPVVSLGFDPDGLIRRFGVGEVVSDLEQFTQACEEFLEGRRQVAPEAFHRVLKLFDLKAHGDCLRQMIRAETQSETEEDVRVIKNHSRRAKTSS